MSTDDTTRHQVAPNRPASTVPGTAGPAPDRPAPGPADPDRRLPPGGTPARSADSAGRVLLLHRHARVRERRHRPSSVITACRWSGSDSSQDPGTPTRHGGRWRTLGDPEFRADQLTDRSPGRCAPAGPARVPTHRPRGARPVGADDDQAGGCGSHGSVRRPPGPAGPGTAPYPHVPPAFRQWLAARRRAPVRGDLRPQPLT